MQAYNERWAQQLEAPVSIDAYAAQAADFKVGPPFADSALWARGVNMLHHNTPQQLLKGCAGAFLHKQVA